MKLITPVSRVEVKRAFVASQKVRYQRHRHYLPFLSSEEFSKKLALAKKTVQKFSDAQLDRIIGKEYAPRRDAYNSVDWYIGNAKINELGTWKGAGGLPIAWTSGSLEATARKVARAMKNNSKLLNSRIKRSVPRILQTSAEMVQEDRYLFPIILPPGTIKQCRQGVKKFKGDIDDGNMRSIALAIGGKKTIKAYIGVRKL